VRLPPLLRRGHDTRADVAVLGSGLPALTAALELARRRARVRVVVPAGAGGRPAGLGLVVLGPARPYDRVAGALGAGPARELWAAGRENLVRLREFLSSARGDCGLQERGSFLLAANREEAEALAESEDRLRDDGFSGEFLDHYMLETRFDVSGFSGAYWAAEGAEVDLQALYGALSEAARAAGVELVAAPVRAVDAGPSGVVVETADATVRASALVLASDASATGHVAELEPLLQREAGARRRVAPESGAALPSAARTVDGRLAWIASGPAVTLAAIGTARGDEEERLAAIAPRLHARSGPRQAWSEPSEGGAGGLPVVGQVPGRPLVAACGFSALAASFAFVAARWTADAVLTGRDPSPDALRPGASASLRPV